MLDLTMIGSLVLSLVSLMLVLEAAATSPKCQSMKGEVEWWIMLAVPTSKSIGYLYIDSESENFRRYMVKPDAAGTPLFLTLQQIKALDLQIAAWNDQPPEMPAQASVAHSKGFFATGQNFGFLITHSLTKFPFFNQEGKLSFSITSQGKFAQHILCISFTSIELTNYLEVLRIIRANVYFDPYFFFKSKLNAKTAAPSVFLKTKINNFTVVAKNGFKNGSIYQDSLNQAYGQLLAVSWGRPAQQSWCGSPSVTNVRTLKFKDTQWVIAQDHSKWVVTKRINSGSRNVVCLGDLNRMKTQWKRGGAFYCIENQNLAQAFRSLISESDSCALPSFH